MHRKTIVCAIVLYVITSTSFKLVTSNSARDLKNHLFAADRYDKTVRPVLNWTTQTIVDMHLAIITILDFNDVQETLSITAILELSWKDEFLTWDAENFDNLSHVSFPQNDIWKPYITLENTVKKMGELGTSSLTVDVHSDGEVEWRPIEVLETSCAVDVTKFPFDTQKCELLFETNGYESEELELNINGSEVELHEYKGTASWIIESTGFERSFEEETMHIVAWITLKRKPMFFVLNIFLPICLLTLLNLLVFLLPVESGEKVSFVVTIFLSLAVFLTIVSGQLPENSESISLLNVYVFTSTIMSTLSVIITILQIRFHSYDSNVPIPRLLWRLTQICSSSKVQSNSDETERTFRRKASVNQISVKSVVGKTQPPSKKNWQTVVKGLDNFFFLLFFVFYIVFTLTWIIIASNA